MAVSGQNVTVDTVADDVDARLYTGSYKIGLQAVDKVKQTTVLVKAALGVTDSYDNFLAAYKDRFHGIDGLLVNGLGTYDKAVGVVLAALAAAAAV